MCYRLGSEAGPYDEVTNSLHWFLLFWPRKLTLLFPLISLPEANRNIKSLVLRDYEWTLCLFQGPFAFKIKYARFESGLNVKARLWPYGKASYLEVEALLIHIQNRQRNLLTLPPSELIWICGWECECVCVCVWCGSTAPGGMVLSLHTISECSVLPSNEGPQGICNDFPN